MSREEALQLVKERLPNKNLRKHVYAVEAVMCALARKFDEDEEAWSLAGLLHDLDYEETKDTPERHTLLTIEILEKHSGLNDEILQAIRAHVGNIERKSLMDKSIYCADPVTGFLVACALMHPSKRLAEIDIDFIKRRYKEKRFAAGASREQMAACSEIGLELDDFLVLSKDAMAGISKELGL